MAAEVEMEEHTHPVGKIETTPDNNIKLTLPLSIGSVEYLFNIQYGEFKIQVLTPAGLVYRDAMYSVHWMHLNQTPFSDLGEGVVPLTWVPWGGSFYSSPVGSKGLNTTMKPNVVDAITKVIVDGINNYFQRSPDSYRFQTLLAKWKWMVDYHQVYQEYHAAVAAQEAASKRVQEARKANDSFVDSRPKAISDPELFEFLRVESKLDKKDAYRRRR